MSFRSVVDDVTNVLGDAAETAESIEEAFSDDSTSFSSDIEEAADQVGTIARDAEAAIQGAEEGVRDRRAASLVEQFPGGGIGLAAAAAGVVWLAGR